MNWNHLAISLSPLLVVFEIAQQKFEDEVCRSRLATYKFEKDDYNEDEFGAYNSLEKKEREGSSAFTFTVKTNSETSEITGG